jgi:hypothetical protein
MELKAPPFWHYMLYHLFQVQNPRLREQLWRAYPKSTAFRWQLALCGEPAPSKPIMYERAKRLCQHLNPATLLHTAEGLVPVGKPRPKELRQFEETVLYLTDRDGNFIWRGEEHTDDRHRIERAPAHSQT